MSAQPDLGDRRQYIGGSDMAAILGLSRWKTPLQLYLEKVGDEPQSSEETLNQAVGKALEPVLAAEYEARHGVTLQRQVEVTMPDHPYIMAHLDGLAPGRIWEGKSAVYGSEWGEAGTDAVPESYLAQVTIGAACAQESAWDLSVIFGGRNYAEYGGTLDADLVRLMVEAAADFWQRVQRRDPPDPTTYEDCARRWPKSTGAAVSATAELARMVAELKGWKEREKQAAGAIDYLKYQIQSAIGEAEALTDDEGRPLVTWKSSKQRHVIDWQAIADAAGADAALVKQHTTTKPGPRVFLIK